MGLLTPPSLRSGPGYAVAQTAISKRLLSSLLMVGNAVYAGTDSSSQGVLFRWNNITNPAGFDQLNQSNIFVNDVLGVCAGGGQVYFGSSNLDAVSHFNRLVVIKSPTDPFSATTNALTGANGNYGTANSAAVSSTDGGLATDGSNLYLLSGHTAENAWVTKWSLGGGAASLSGQLPNPTTGNARWGATLAIDPAGTTLWGCGGSANGWVMSVSTSSFAAPTMLNVTLGFPHKTSFVDATYYWLADVLSSSIYRVNRDLSAFTTFPIPDGGSLTGFSPDPNGSLIWVAQNGGSRSRTCLVRCIDKTGALIAIRDTGLTNVTAVWGLYPLGALVVTGDPSGGVDSSIAYVPFWSDFSQGPRPVGGRGAGW